MFVAIAIVTFLLFIVTLLPYLPLRHGLVRIGDFPRQQILVVALVLGVSVLAFSDRSTAWLSIVTITAFIVLAQLPYILPFTRIWRRQSAQYDPEIDRGDKIRLIAWNVKMSNRRYGDLMTLIRANDPDFFLLMETDAQWLDGIRPVLETYPHRVEKPLDNSYGMVLASRLALGDTSVQFLLTDGVPSIFTTVTTKGKRKFRLMCVHPEPPVPYQSTEGRDGEMSLVAKRAKELTLPVIVTGDLNDVAWSRTTDRFRHISQLLDPRIGRMIFSTFDARYPLLRWPLDHLFHSSHFRYASMSRLDACGSDHFPVLFDLVLCSDPRQESNPEEAEEAELSDAEEDIREAAKRDEEPIGSQWEKQ